MSVSPVSAMKLATATGNEWRREGQPGELEQLSILQNALGWLT